MSRELVSTACCAHITLSTLTFRCLMVALILEWDNKKSFQHRSYECEISISNNKPCCKKHIICVWKIPRVLNCFLYCLIDLSTSHISQRIAQWTGMRLTWKWAEVGSNFAVFCLLFHPHHKPSHIVYSSPVRLYLFRAGAAAIQSLLFTMALSRAVDAAQRSQKRRNNRQTIWFLILN